MAMIEGESLLRVQAGIENPKVLTADTKFLHHDTAILPLFDGVVFPTLFGCFIRHIGRRGNSSAGSWCRRNAGGGPNRPGRRTILVSRLIHADLRADCAVEVIATAVDPGIVRTELDGRNIVCLGDALASIAFLDSIDRTLVLDTQISFFRKIMAVGLQLVVEKQLDSGNTLGLGDRLAGISLLNRIFLTFAGGACRCR